MKKVLSVIFVMTLCLMLTAQAAGVTVTVGKQTVEQGTGIVSVEIPIVLSGNTGLAGMELMVSYAEGLTLTALTQGSGLNSLTFGMPGNLNANPIKLAWDGQDADSTNGTIMTMTFSVSAETVTKYPITVTVTEGGTYDNDLNDVAVVITNGSIIVATEQQEDTQPELNGKCKVFGGPYIQTAEKTVPCGLIFAHAQTQFGNYTLKEYGVLFSEKNLSGNAFVIGADSVFKAQGLKARNTSGQFGILFYGSNIQYGKIYYVLPYAIYEHTDGTAKTVYGTEVVSFMPEQ